MTPLSCISSQRSLPSRVRSPTPANTETPPCFMAMLLMSSMMMTVLPTPAPPNSPILPPLQVRLEQVDDLDAGLEHLRARSTVLRASAPADESASAPRSRTGPIREVDRLAEHVEHAAERLRPDRHRDRRAEVDDLHAALHAVGRLHRDGAHAVLADVLLHLARRCRSARRAADFGR